MDLIKADSAIEMTNTAIQEKIMRYLKEFQRAISDEIVKAAKKGTDFVVFDLPYYVDFADCRDIIQEVEKAGYKVTTSTLCGTRSITVQWGVSK